MKVAKQVHTFTSIEIEPDRDSLLILMSTRFCASHAGAVFTFEDGSQEIIHAVGEGVIFGNPKKFQEDHFFLHLVDLTPHLKTSAQEMYEDMSSQVGIPYSHMIQFLGFLPKIGKFLQKKLTDGGTTVKCSELMAIAVEKHCGFDLWENLDFVCPKQYITKLNAHIKSISKDA